MLKQTIVTVILCQAAALFGAAAWTPGAEIPDGGGDTVKVDVSLVYNSNSGKMYAAWADNSPGNEPYASIFDGTWTTSPIPMGASSPVTENVNLAYDSATHDVYAVWGDQGGPQTPYFSVHNGASWSMAAAIPLGASNGVLNDVNIAYYASISRMIVAWTDSISTAPFFSSYNGMMWTTGSIALGASTGVNQDVTLAYDSTGTRIFAAWTDSVTSGAYASRYDGMSWTTAAIPMGASSGAHGNIELAFDPTGNRMFAAWTDSVTHQPYFSTFSSGSWSTADTIPLGPSAGAFVDVFLAYNPSSNLMFAAWANLGSQFPYFATYNGTSWSTPEIISLGISSGAAYDVILAYHAGLNQVFAAWQDSGSGVPVWSQYVDSSSLTPRPPNFLRPDNRRPRIVSQ